MRSRRRLLLVHQRRRRGPERRRGRRKDEGEALKRQAAKGVTSLIDVAPLIHMNYAAFRFKNITKPSHWEEEEEEEASLSGTFVKHTKPSIIHPHKQITHE